MKFCFITYNNLKAGNRIFLCGKKPFLQIPKLELLFYIKLNLNETGKKNRKETFP